MPTNAHDIVARLAVLDSCAVSDALDQLGIQQGTAEDIGPVTSVRRLAGRVLTVELEPVGRSTSKHHLGTAAIEAAGPGDVIVVAHQGRTDCAGWGGTLSRAAMLRGVAGAIVHGAVRDVDEAEALGFAVFAGGSTPRTARGRAQERSWGEPVDVAAVTVHAGDFVVADSTGVVFLPAWRADVVVRIAESIMAKEAAIAARLDDGLSATQAMGQQYEAMLRPGEDR